MKYIYAISRITLICLISAILGKMGITAKYWEFWIILFSSTLLYWCGWLDHLENTDKKLKTQSDYTCASCEHLKYNSDGSVECQMEWEHKCRPETRVMYKDKRIKYMDYNSETKADNDIFKQD